MAKTIDLTGQRFGLYTVIKQTESTKTAHGAKWLCKCDCGRTREVLGYNLRNGTSTSCGCKMGKEYRQTLKEQGEAPEQVQQVQQPNPLQENESKWVTVIGALGFKTYCSKCKGECLRHPRRQTLAKTAYCPHCGRKMRGATE